MSLDISNPCDIEKNDVPHNAFAFRFSLISAPSFVTYRNTKQKPSCQSKSSEKSQQTVN